MMVRQCDKCNKIIEGDRVDLIEQRPIPEDDYVMASMEWKDPDKDYCQTCQRKMIATGYKRGWNAYKAKRKTTTDAP